MRKKPLRALPVLVLAAVAVFVLSSGTSPARATGGCDVEISGTGSSYAGPVGTVLSGTETNCGTGAFPAWSWYRDGVQISGAQSSTYTTTSSDTGHSITATYIWTLPSTGSQASTDSFVATGSSILSDEFNGANGSEPSSSLWTIHKQAASATDHMNYRSSSSDAPGTPLSSNIEEVNGALLIRATYCASSCGTDPNGSWYSAMLWSANQYSGTRVVEARVMLPCNTQTGFADLFGSENNPSWTGGTKSYEGGLGEWPTGGGNDDSVGMGADHWFNQNSSDRQWAAGNAYPLGQGVNVCGAYHTFTEVVNAYSAWWEFDGVTDTANPSPGYQGHPNYWWDDCAGPATSLAATASAGATTITVDSVAGFVAGQVLTINTNGTAETPTISSVNATTNQITFSPALASSHTAGASTTLSAAASAGATSVSVTSATDLYAGESVTLDTGTKSETKTISTVVGTTVTFTTALAYDHSSGAPLTASTVSGHAIHADGSSCTSTWPYQGSVMNATTGTTNNIGYASGESMAAKPVYMGFAVENLRSKGDPTGTADVPLYVDWVHVYNN